MELLLFSASLEPNKTFSRKVDDAVISLPISGDLPCVVTCYKWCLADWPFYALVDWASFLSSYPAWSFTVTELLKDVLVCICDAMFTVWWFVTGCSDQVRKKNKLILALSLAGFVKVTHVVIKLFAVLSLSPGQCERHTRYSIGVSCAMEQPAPSVSLLASDNTKSGTRLGAARSVCCSLPECGGAVELKLVRSGLKKIKK